MSIQDKVRSIILSRTTHKDNRKIGIEEECILHTSDNKRLPVNRGNSFSAIDLLNIMNDKKGVNGEYSLEPGGQLEWSSPPYKDLNKLESAMREHHRLLDGVTLENELKIIDYALEPIYTPEEVELIDQKKYHLMDESMAINGKMGKWMMRNTASIQVNLDTIDDKDMEEMVFIADCVHPVAAYLFANCPYKERKKTGMQNIRHLIWENTDSIRCRNLFDHGIFDSECLIDKYIEYVMSVPNIFQIDRDGKIVHSKKNIKDQLRMLEHSENLVDQDIHVALHQIFTNVRLKNLVEVRGSDRTPRGFEMAPVAFWTGILTEKKTRDQLLNIFNNWSKKDRVIFNNSALKLNREQQGPDNRSYGDWISIIGDLALEGLKNRNLKEEGLFLNFFNLVMDSGPFSLQRQVNAPTYSS